MKKLLLFVGGAATGMVLGFVVARVSASVVQKLSESVREEDLSFEEMLVGFAEMPPATPFMC